MKTPLPLVDQEFIYPKDWAISVFFPFCRSVATAFCLKASSYFRWKVMLEASTGPRASLFPRQ
jgi:hypothetical protein